MNRIDAFFTGLAKVTFHASNPKEAGPIPVAEKVLAAALAVVSAGFVPLVGYCINRGVSHMSSYTKVSNAVYAFFYPKAAAAERAATAQKLLDAAHEYCASIPKNNLVPPSKLSVDLQNMLLPYAQPADARETLSRVFTYTQQEKLKEVEDGLPVLFAKTDAGRSPMIKITNKNGDVHHFNHSKEVAQLVDNLVEGLESPQATTVKAFLDCIAQCAVPQQRWLRNFGKVDFNGTENYAYEIDLTKYPIITITNTRVTNFEYSLLDNIQSGLKKPFSALALLKIEINCEAEGVADAAAKFLNPNTQRRGPEALEIANILMKACTVQTAEVLVNQSTYVDTTNLAYPSEHSSQQLPSDLRAMLQEAIG